MITDKKFLFTYISKLIDENVDEIENVVISGMTFKEAKDLFNQLNIENFGYDVYEFLDVPIYSTNKNKQERISEYWNSQIQ